MNNEILDQPEQVLLISVDEIRPFADQPRKYFDLEFIESLASSFQNPDIKQIQPVVVKILVPPIDGFIYELICGEQRWRACKMAGIEKIKAIVREVKSDKEQYILSVADNILQSSLTQLEEVCAIERLRSLEMSQYEIARLFKKSQGWVQVRDRVGKLSPKVHALLSPEIDEQKRLTLMQAYLLVDLPEENQIELAQKISKEGLSVTDSRRIVAKRVRRLNIKLAKNTSRLRMVEDVKQVNGFIERTKNYIENLLQTNKNKFYNMFDGEKYENIVKSQSSSESISKMFAELGDILHKVSNGILSNSRELEVKLKPKKVLPKESKRIEQMQTVQMLKSFGLTRDMLYGQRRKNRFRLPKYVSFWNRPLDFQTMLEKARESYLDQIKIAHPDKPTGTNIKARNLNMMWGILKKRFAARGYVLN